MNKPIVSRSYGELKSRKLDRVKAMNCLGIRNLLATNEQDDAWRFRRKPWSTLGCSATSDFEHDHNFCKIYQYFHNISPWVTKNVVSLIPVMDNICLNFCTWIRIVGELCEFYNRRKKENISRILVRFFKIRGLTDVWQRILNRNSSRSPDISRKLRGVIFRDYSKISFFNPN